MQNGEGGGDGFCGMGAEPGGGILSGEPEEVVIFPLAYSAIDRGDVLIAECDAEHDVIAEGGLVARDGQRLGGGEWGRGVVEAELFAELGL